MRRKSRAEAIPADAKRENRDFRFSLYMIHGLKKYDYKFSCCSNANKPSFSHTILGMHNVRGIQDKVVVENEDLPEISVAERTIRVDGVTYVVVDKVETEQLEMIAEQLEKLKN